MKWTPEHDAIALEMSAADASIEDIATRLGRTKKSVSGHLRWLRLPPERQALESSRRRGGDKPLPQFNQRRVAQVPADFVPVSVLQERDQRNALMPRSITAFIFGDPIPGRSALDQRQVQR
jgi:hypothetical protein